MRMRRRNAASLSSVARSSNARRVVMAESPSADVVIVGAGAVGGMAAYKLATVGVKTLLLEAGPRIDRNAALSRFWESKHKGPNSPYESTPYAPHPEIDQ